MMKIECLTTSSVLFAPSPPSGYGIWNKNNSAPLFRQFEISTKCCQRFCLKQTPLKIENNIGGIKEANQRRITSSKCK